MQRSGQAVSILFRSTCVSGTILPLHIAGNGNIRNGIKNNVINTKFMA